MGNLNSSFKLSWPPPLIMALKTLDPAQVNNVIKYLMETKVQFCCFNTYIVEESLDLIKITNIMLEATILVC